MRITTEQLRSIILSEVKKSLKEGGFADHWGWGNDYEVFVKKFPNVAKMVSADEFDSVYKTARDNGAYSGGEPSRVEVFEIFLNILNQKL